MKQLIYYLLVLGLILRLVSLNQSFWLDEATSALVARDMSFKEIITSFAPGDFHPPFYYLLLKGWGMVLGVNEISLRLFSIVFALGTIYLVYLIGNQIIDKRKRVGTLGAMLLATAPLHIYFSQEARMYVLASFLVCLSVYFFVKTLGQGRIGEWLGLALSLALLGMTHYLSLIILGVFWIFGFWSKPKPAWWKKFYMSHIILGVVGLAWFPVLRQQLQAGLGVQSAAPGWWNVLGRTDFKSILLVPIKFMIGRIGFDNRLVYGLLVGLAGVVFGFLFLQAKKSFQKTKLIWLWLLLPIVSLAFLGLRVSVFSYFRLLFVLPAFYLIVALGLANVAKKYFAPILLIVVSLNIAFSLVYLLNPKYHREDWRGLVKFIQEESREKNSIILFVNDSQMEAYNYYNQEDKIAGPDGFADEYDQIWLMRYVQPIFDPEDNLRKKIEESNYQKKQEYDFNGVVVWQYQENQD